MTALTVIGTSPIYHEAVQSLSALVKEFQALDQRRMHGGLRLGEAERYREVFAQLTRYLSRDAPQHERREFLRVPRPMTLSFSRDDRDGSGLAIDFGGGGLFLVSDARLAVGDVLRLDHVVVGKQHRRLKVEAVVAWRCPDEEPAGVGLAFRIQTPRERAEVDELFHELLAMYLHDDERRREVATGD